MNLADFSTEVGDLAEDYIALEKKRIELIVIRYLSLTAGAIIGTVIGVMLFFLTLIFLGFTTVYSIYMLTGDIVLAFASVTVFFIIAGAVVYLARKRLFVSPMIKTMIAQLHKQQLKSSQQ